MMLPYTVLLLYGVMRGVNATLLAAASSMGAGRVARLCPPDLPAPGRPGLASAGLLSFILSLGYYITPALMGGPNQTMIATLINQQVTKENQWNRASSSGRHPAAAHLRRAGQARQLLGASRKKRSAS
ncbi:hypothetical protein SVIOM74S_03264 [Streptomyces violarus]